MMRRSSLILIMLLAIGVLASCGTGGCKKCSDNQTVTNNIIDTTELRNSCNEYNLFNIAKLCNVLYDYNSRASEINQATDTIHFDNNLYFIKDRLYLHNKKILCFEDVLAFEQVVYMEVDNIKYLYMYPFNFTGGEKDDEGNDLGILAWEDCGVLIKFENNSYSIFHDVAYFDGSEFCSIPTKQKGIILNHKENKCLKYVQPTK